MLFSCFSVQHAELWYILGACTLQVFHCYYYYQKTVLNAIFDCYGYSREVTDKFSDLSWLLLLDVFQEKSFRLCMTTNAIEPYPFVLGLMTMASLKSHIIIGNVKLKLHFGKFLLEFM